METGLAHAETFSEAPIACTLTFKVLFKGAISTIRHGGYLLKGYVMAIACTLSFALLMNLWTVSA